MNCKPGDLAVIVASQATENIGCIVEVLDASHPCPCGCTSREQYWSVRCHGRALVAFDLFGRRSEVKFADCPDRVLRPIRDPGDDAVDEVLERVGAPSYDEVPS